jgi:glutamate dehydrogenase
MTDEVATLVLRDNYLQSQALSMLETRSAKDLLEHAHTIRSLELSGLLNRSLEFLPSIEEIGERHKAGGGLTRPELAILICYAKMALYSLLIDSDVPEDPYLRHELDRYFPTLMQRRLGRYLGQHRLRREIIATATTNSMVNRMGATFARRAQEDTGANAATIVRAYAIAREAFDMRTTWGQIEDLDTRIGAATQYEMMFETTRLLRFCTYWLIHRHANKLDIEQQVSRLQDSLSQLDGVLPRVLTGTDLAEFEARRAHYRAAEVPEGLSRRMASLTALRSGPDLVEIATQTRQPIEAAAIAYFGIGTALSLDWLRQQIESLEVGGHWQAIARTTLRDNLYNLQRGLCLQVLGRARKAAPAQALEAWLDGHQQVVDHLRQTVNDMRSLPAMDFATLSVALQAVRRAAEG